MDMRVEHIFWEHMHDDKSFQEKEHPLALIFGTSKFSQEDMRETWHRGIKYGIEIGLNRASLEGQIIELEHNTKNSKHKEFIEKFYQLANEYNCAIQYHPRIGMVIVSKDIF